MSFYEKITDDLKEAMKAKDLLRISCIRMLKTSLKHKQAERGEILRDEEIQSLISSLIRKGREAAEEFRKGGREDLAVKEEGEVAILYGYLPDQIKPDEIERVLKEVISELSADGLKDLGKVMKAAMNRIAGRAQGKEVNEIARRLLS
ncbi:MAG: glutamyl-tRNA amidotransferase [Deltaproteobacteria bacterium RBG_19FT_COMBO_46_9]|nr:MAG: glutamyl-tRNA amidotransferase [Deltaproteobacteria bacterium RBG_19FT_COMBO_46_9]